MEIKIKDEDIEYGNIYSGNVSEWFPRLREERIKEYNNFINGFVFIYNKLFEISPKLNLTSIERCEFSSNLALYASSSIFANSDSMGSKSIFYFDLNTGGDFTNTNLKLVTSKLRNSFIRSIKDELVDLESKIDSFYNSVSSYSESKLFSFIEKVNNKIDISYNNINLVYPELEFSNNSNLDNNDYNNNQRNIDFFSKYRGETIAGNKLAKSSLINFMNIILCYNIEKKKNHFLDLFEFSNIITLIGGAGVGKSMLINQALDYVSINASKLGKPFVFIPINSDTKSEYRSLSERNLKRKFDIAYRGDSINVILIEEIDTKIFSRNNIDMNNVSELSYTGAFLDAIDGNNKYLGNFLVISTSNRALDSDDALKRRLMKNVIYVKGLETIEDYTIVFKNKLYKGIENNYVKISNWEKISQISKDYSFQGGDIANICFNMLNNIISNLDLTSVMNSDSNEDRNIDKNDDSNEDIKENTKKENTNEDGNYDKNHKKIYTLLDQIPTVTEDILINEINNYYQNNILISNDKLSRGCLS